MFNFIRSCTLIMVTVAIFHSVSNIAVAETVVVDGKKILKNFKDRDGNFDIDVQVERVVDKKVGTIERRAREREEDEREYEREERELEKEIRKSAHRMKRDILKNLKTQQGLQIHIDEDEDEEDERDHDDKKIHKEIKIAMNNDDGPPVEIIVPIAFFMTFPFCLFLLFYFKYRTNKEKQITLRTMVENGTNIPPEMFMEGKSRLTPIEKDRKNGIVYTLSSIGIILFLLVLNAGPKGLWSIGLIPLLMGIGNLINWKLASGDDQKEVEIEEVVTKSAE